MICLITDRVEPWLIYIWQQFARINRLESDYKFFTYDQLARIHDEKNCILTLEYSCRQKIPQSLFIPRRNEFTTDDYLWFFNDLPVFSDTFEEKFGEFDVFYNAFVHLSRLEEWLYEKKGKRIYSYASKHPRKDKRIWKIPVVNLLFNRLETMIKEKGPGILFGEKVKPLIQFSHDVDYIRKTIQLRIKQSSHYFLNSLRYFARNEHRKSMAKFKKAIEIGVKNADYWLFDTWSELESKLNISSVYFFYAKVKSTLKSNGLSWLLDPSYDIKNNIQLINKCHEIISRGHEIGIHGSFYSAGDESLFKRERDTLEKVIGRPIRSCRQHWFNYIENVTPAIHEKTGISTDSSLGFNDIKGFRSGIASVYNPYNHCNQRAFSFDEIPAVIMDVHVEHRFDCATDFDWLFKYCDVVKSFAVSVDWHQRGASPEYGWFESYEKLCKDYKSKVADQCYNRNPYLMQVWNVLPRIFSLFDIDSLSPTYGVGDRYRWAWKLIDFGNGTYQGAAHGLARLLADNMLPEDLIETSILNRIEAIFHGTETLRYPNGSMVESFPYESSFCVTALVAYDLLSAITLLKSKFSASTLKIFFDIIRPLIQFLHKRDETHAFISNHLATASAALFKWSALTGESGEKRGIALLDRIIKKQSSEGWFREYEGADPGYQSLCICYLAELHRMRPDLDIFEALRLSIKFLWHFAHPDGSFGGLYGSRNTRFYFPAGVEALALEIPEAASLAQFMRHSISQCTTVTLAAMDDSNLIPMFNSYCRAASLINTKSTEFNDNGAETPSVSKMVFRRYYPEAGILIDKGKNYYTVISVHKGGVCYHFHLDNGTKKIDCGAAAKDSKGILFSTQSYNSSNEVQLIDNRLEIIANFVKIHREIPTPVQFILLRLLNNTLMRNESICFLFKKAIVKLLITGKKISPVKNSRCIRLCYDIAINDKWVNNPGKFTRVKTERTFSTIHMASQGYWQRQDDKQ